MRSTQTVTDNESIHAVKEQRWKGKVLCVSVGLYVLLVDLKVVIKRKRRCYVSEEKKRG